MIFRAKADDERRTMETIKQRGGEGGREWYNFMRGESVTQGEISEIIVGGELITDRVEIARAIEDFWRGVGGIMDEETMDLTDQLSLPVGNFDSVETCITREEIKGYLGKLKNEKAAGLDTIPYEMYKYGGEWVVENLYRLYEQIWREKRVPSGWNDTLVTPSSKRRKKS